jgi:hypothetical protein
MDMKGKSEEGRGDCRGSISYSHQKSELIEGEDFTIHHSSIPSGFPLGEIVALKFSK